MITVKDSICKVLIMQKSIYSTSCAFISSRPLLLAHTRKLPVQYILIGQFYSFLSWTATVGKSKGSNFHFWTANVLRQASGSQSQVRQVTEVCVLLYLKIGFHRLGKLFSEPFGNITADQTAKFNRISQYSFGGIWFNRKYNHSCRLFLFITLSLSLHRPSQGTSKCRGNIYN